MSIPDFPDPDSLTAGGYWSRPAMTFLTSSGAEDFATTPYDDGGIGHTYKYARAISAGNAAVTITLTPLNGGTPQLITLDAFQQRSMFYEACLTPVGGDVTHHF